MHSLWKSSPYKVHGLIGVSFPHFSTKWPDRNPQSQRIDLNFSQLIPYNCMKVLICPKPYFCTAIMPKNIFACYPRFSPYHDFMQAPVVLIMQTGRPYALVNSIPLLSLDKVAIELCSNL